MQQCDGIKRPGVVVRYDVQDGGLACVGLVARRRGVRYRGNSIDRAPRPLAALDGRLPSYGMPALSAPCRPPHHVFHMYAGSDRPEMRRFECLHVQRTMLSSRAGNPSAARGRGVSVMLIKAKRSIAVGIKRSIDLSLMVCVLFFFFFIYFSLRKKQI